jgi:hypothetical protein
MWCCALRSEIKGMIEDELTAAGRPQAPARWADVPAARPAGT